MCMCILSLHEERNGQFFPPGAGSARSAQVDVADVAYRLLGK